MPVFKNVLGLDLGGHSLKAVEVQQTFRGLEFVQLQAALCEADPLSAERIRQFVDVHQLYTEQVVTALRADRISSRRLTFPFRERRKLAQAVPFELEDNLPFDIDDVVLAWEVVGGDRSRAEVVATVAQRAQVSELIATLHEAGCDPKAIEAEGLVLGNLTALWDLPGTRLLVDIGHRKTTICALVDGRAVGARSVAAAGQALTEAIALDRELGLEDAERSKHETGIFAPGQARPMPRAEAVLERIAGEILRTIAAFEPVLGAGGVSEITLLGGSAQLERIDDWFGQRTGVPTSRLGMPREEFAEVVAGGPHLLFAPAIALALRGTALSTTEMNFRQDEFARRVDFGRYRRQFGPTGALAALVGVLAVVSFGSTTIVEARRAKHVEAQISSLYDQVFPGKPISDNPMAAMRAAVDDARERANFLGVYRGNLSALDLLAEISRRIPEDLDVIFEELSIDRQTIRIRVYSKSFEAADRLGAELGKYGPFVQARIGAIETDSRRGGKKFNVTISLSEESA